MDIATNQKNEKFCEVKEERNGWGKERAIRRVMVTGRIGSNCEGLYLPS